MHQAAAEMQSPVGMMSTNLVMMGYLPQQVDQWCNGNDGNNRLMQQLVYTSMSEVLTNKTRNITQGSYSTSTTISRPTVLFDGGTFNHNFGLNTVTYRTNFRKVDPFLIQTAGGIVFMDQQCDLAIPGSTSAMVL